MNRYENKENKYCKSGQPCNLCRRALNRVLPITRDILLFVDLSIVITYILMKIRGIFFQASTICTLKLEMYYSKYHPRKYYDIFKFSKRHLKII